MKTSATIIARRYAAALFDVTASTNTQHHVEADFAALKPLLSEGNMFAKMLASPLLSRSEQEKAVLAVLKHGKAHAKTSEFLGLLARKKRLRLLAEIIAQYEGMLSKARGELPVEIVSALPLKEKDASSIGERLSKIYGKQVKLAVKQNTGLLGGVVITIGSLQLDGSLSGKLQRLRNKLKAA